MARQQMVICVPRVELCDTALLGTTRVAYVGLCFFPAAVIVQAASLGMDS